MFRRGLGILRRRLALLLLKARRRRRFVPARRDVGVCFSLLVQFCFFRGVYLQGEAGRAVIGDTSVSGEEVGVVVAPRMLLVGVLLIAFLLVV